MRLVFISSVIATKVLRITSAVKASTTVILIPVPSSQARSGHSDRLILRHPLFAVLCILMVFFRILFSPLALLIFFLTARHSPLFDHPVRSRKHVRRDRQADILSGFQIDDELELLR